VVCQSSLNKSFPGTENAIDGQAFSHKTMSKFSTINKSLDKMHMATFYQVM
jgi:hypothetical protein